MAFRAFIFFNLAFRAVSPTWHSKSLSLISLTFKAMFSVWRLELHLQFDVQSHHLFLVWHSEPLSFLSLGVQSRYLFSIWRSESLFLHSLEFRAINPIMIRHLLSHFSTFKATFLAFRAIVHSLEFRSMFSVWRSEQSSYHDRTFITTFLAFNATFLAFKAISSVWAFRASSLVFNVIIFF